MTKARGAQTGRDILQGTTPVEKLNEREPRERGRPTVTHQRWWLFGLVGNLIVVWYMILLVTVAAAATATAENVLSGFDVADIPHRRTIADTHDS